MRKHQLIIILFLLFNSVFLFAETRLAPQHEIVADGRTQLSPYFSIELSGNGWLAPRVLKVFHHNKAEKTLLGVARFSEHASRQNGYAISDDGKTILYFHQKLPKYSDVDKPGGLFEFQHDRGDKHLHHFINNTQYLPIQLPPNIIVFTKLKRRTDVLKLDSTVYLRDTNGNERPWQP